MADKLEERRTLFVEAEGLVHLINPVMAEFTLCGDAFDLASDIDGYGWRETTKRAVTCEPCAAIVTTCRGVRIKLGDPS